MTNPDSAENWFIAKDGQQQGPLTYQALLESIRQGNTKPSDMVWTAGFEKWLPAAEVAGLFSPPTAGSPTATSPQLQPPPLIGASDRPAKVSDALRDDLLDRFIGSSPTKKNYYRRVFGQILDDAGVRNKSLDEITLPEIKRIVPKFSHTLPFRHDTTFNWAAFFFSGYWMMWRTAYLRWLFAAAVLLFPILTEITPSIRFMHYIGWAAAYIVAGLYGNRFLLAQFLVELKAGQLRAKPTKPLSVILLVLTALVISIVLAARS